MLIWGCISAAQAGVKNYGGLFATRFLLGFAEAPYFPGYGSLHLTGLFGSVND